MPWPNSCSEGFRSSPLLQTVFGVVYLLPTIVMILCAILYQPSLALQSNFRHVCRFFTLFLIYRVDSHSRPACMPRQEYATASCISKDCQCDFISISEAAAADAATAVAAAATDRDYVSIPCGFESNGNGCESP